MIATLRRVFRPIGRSRREAADSLIHDLRNATQAAKTERWLLERDRARIDRSGHFWRDFLLGADDEPPETT